MIRADGFDARKIRIIEPPHPRTRKSATTTMIATSTIPSEIPAVSHKRPFDNIDDASVSKEEEQKHRPRKKARIDVHALVFPELYDDDDDPPQSCPKKKTQSSARDESAFKPTDVQRFSIFPNPSRKASQAINQRFLSQIRRHHQTPADESNDIS